MLQKIWRKGKRRKMDEKQTAEHYLLMHAACGKSRQNRQYRKSHIQYDKMLKQSTTERISRSQ